MKKKVKYRKAMDPKNGCEKCGHLIGIRVAGGYSCVYCGFEKPPVKMSEMERIESGCLCWTGCCPIHGLNL